MPGLGSEGRREFEGVAVCGSDDAEVSAVQGGDAFRPEAFSDGDQAGVGAAEGQVLVALDEIPDALPVGGPSSVNELFGPAQQLR